MVQTAEPMRLAIGVLVLAIIVGSMAAPTAAQPTAAESTAVQSANVQPTAAQSVSQTGGATVVEAGEVYEAFRERTDLGYTRYSEIVNKLDELRILETEYADLEGRGRSRELRLAYETDAVLDRLE